MEVRDKAIEDGAQRAREGQERVEKGAQSTLETPRSSDAERSPHHQAQVEGGSVNQQAFQDVRVTTEVGTLLAALSAVNGVPPGVARSGAEGGRWLGSAPAPWIAMTPRPADGERGQSASMIE